MMQDSHSTAAHAIFEPIWKQLVSESGSKAPKFPKFILWLNGAPGAGKGTHTKFILKQLGIQSEPVVMSDLLQSPSAKAIKDAGKLVGDPEVVNLLLRRLMQSDVQNGVIVDGFPRTAVQGEVLKLLSKALKGESKFHVVVFSVPEKESVERQLKRGRQTVAHNEEVKKTGKGELQELRKTDTDPDACALRYRTYVEQTESPLKALADAFPCHVIDTDASIEEVDGRILQGIGHLKR